MDKIWINQDKCNDNIIAIGILLLLFTFNLSSTNLFDSVQIDNGFQYDIIGSGGSLTGIVLANLRVFKVVLIFGSLLGISLYTMIKKNRNRPSVHEVTFVR